MFALVGADDMAGREEVIWHSSTVQVSSQQNHDRKSPIDVTSLTTAPSWYHRAHFVDDEQRMHSIDVFRSRFTCAYPLLTLLAYP
jgi:hypothetical protein